jgi:photosystem II stability/assembly factor-like uncharacterized protein
MACRETPRRSHGSLGFAAAVLLGTAAAFLPAQDGPWIVNGPAGGTAFCLVAAPSGSSTLYAGTDNGVFVGERNGASWNPANGGLEGARVKAIAVDPGNSKTLYAGTLTANGVPSIGIFQSLDGGAHWSPINDGLEDPITGIFPLDVAAIAIDPSDSSTLLIGTLFSEIYKSTDGGATWTPKTFGGFNLGLVVTDIRYDPFHPSAVYAASNLGFIASTDGGETWNFFGDAGVGLTALAVDPTTAGTVYGVNATGFGVFKSTDAGATWTAANTNLSVGGVLPLVESIAVDPASPETVVIGTSGDGAFISTDGAATWTAAGPEMRSTFVDSLAFPIGSPSGIYAGTFGAGVYRSDDGAKSWTPSSAGLNASLVHTLIADPAVPGRLVAGAFDGVSVSTDGGASWAPSNAGLPADPVDSLALGAAGKLYAATIGGGLFASTDGGASWQASANGLSDSDIASVAVDPSNPSTVYAGTAHPYDGTNSERVYKSLDGGASWTQTGLDAQGSAIALLIVDPLQPAQVAAIAAPGSASYFQTTNGGSDWSTITPSSACGGVNTVLYDDAHAAILVGGGFGLCRSGDGGGSWTLISVASEASVVSFFVDPTDGSTLYAGAEPLVPGGTGGVFRSTDGGDTWTPVGDGLSAGSVRAIVQDASGDRLYAGIYGGSVGTLWLSTPPRTPIESAPLPRRTRIVSR